MHPKSLFLVLVLLTLILSSCEPGNDRREAIIPEEETIAVINNKKITLAVFQTKLHGFLQYYSDLIQTDEEQLGEIKNIVMNQLIDEELINQEASRKGIQVSEEELDSIMAESMSSYSEVNLESHFKAAGMSEEEWKSSLRQYLVREKLIREEVIKKIPITKREISSYYQENGNQFVAPQALKVRNITLSTEEEATAIHSQLLRGKDFKELIRHHSISPDKIVDGDLGFITKGELPEEMENVVFGKKFNKFKPRYTEVVRSQDGFHVLKLEQYRRAKKISLNEARPRIKQILIEQKWDQYYTRWMEKLREDATISIDQDMLQKEEGF